MKTFKQFFAESNGFQGKPGVIDPRLKKQIHKATVAAAKEKMLKLGVVGIDIGQVQSTGDTSRVNETMMGAGQAQRKLGSKVPYDSHKLWKRDLPPKATFSTSDADGKERAQAIGKDFEGVAGTWDPKTNTGWIYEYYLKRENLR